ncbi:hypothetical protein BD779DRAFT_209435 [Infundibulicybe gibba]|nr:hypothetical protein BD779DRAFT_209435 [Infundibulicybe gibba]
MEQMQNQGPPTTPQRVGQIANLPASLKSTPNSNGTAATSEHLGVPIIDAVSPALFEDIRNHEKRPADIVLGAFLVLCLDEKANNNIEPEDLVKKYLKAVLPICNEMDSQLHSYLKEYVSITSEETTRYKPFVFAFNHALEKLQTVECDELRSPSELNIMFHRNDPKYIVGMHDGGRSSRKPDVVLASLDAVRAAFKTKQDALSKPPDDTWKGFAYKTAGEHPRGNFDWGGIVSSQEFKKNKNITSTLPGSYESDAPCGVIDPQPLPNTRQDADGEICFTEEAEELQQRAPAEVPAPDSGKPEVLPPRRSARLVSSSDPNPMQQQLHSSSSLMASGGGSSGKRKREAKLQKSKKMRVYEHIKLPKRIPAMLQCAAYAAERMSYGFWVTHVINLVIVDDVAYVWYYDNENSVQSFGINFIKDLPYFLVLLLAFQRFDSQNWGEMKEFKQVKTAQTKIQKAKTPTTSQTSSPEGEEEIITLHFSAPESGTPELQFKLCQNGKICGHYGLKGRCTQVLKTTSSSKDPRNRTKTLEAVEMVSKLYWPQASRTPEAEILERARMAGEKAEHNHIKGHLPDLIYTRDFDQYSTNHIRDLLGMETEGGKRVLRWIVYRKLYPITDLIGKEFWRIFWECFRCHLHLWRDGIRHCDISVSNLMYDKDYNRGILNDLDLAQLRDRLPPSGTERTGTMPFMAFDLLQEPAWHGHVEREYRHDAESFAWVLLWICCGYKNGAEIRPRPRPLQDLIQHNFQATHKEKMERATNLNHENLRPTTSYDVDYYNVATSLIHIYHTRHVAAAKPKPLRSNNPQTKKNEVEFNRPGSKHNESVDIDTELQIWRRELEELGFHTVEI